MKFIPTKMHGFLDYLFGILLIAMPWILEYSPGSIEGMVLWMAGTFAFVYSIFTKYELGLIRVLPMPGHLLLDIMSGILLAASPWLFGFADTVYLPHLLLGLFEIVVASLTKTVAEPER